MLSFEDRMTGHDCELLISNQNVIPTYLNMRKDTGKIYTQW